MMRVSRNHLLIVALAAALFSPGCGGNSGSSTNDQNAMQTGSGGSTSSKGPSSCTPTHCTADVEYTLYSQQYCDNAENGPCGAELKAKVQCELANDTCTADNVQDRDKVNAACQSQISAFDMCSAANGAS